MATYKSCCSAISSDTNTLGQNTKKYLQSYTNIGICYFLPSKLLKKSIILILPSKNSLDHWWISLFTTQVSRWISDRNKIQNLLLSWFHKEKSQILVGPCRSLAFHFRFTSGSLGSHRWSYVVSHNSIFQKKINFAKFVDIRKKVTSKGPFHVYVRSGSKNQDNNIVWDILFWFWFLCKNAEV